MLLLNASDGVPVAIDVATAAAMNIEVDKYPSGNVDLFIPVPALPSATLKKVVEWVTHMQTLEEPLRVEIETSPWYTQYFDIDMPALALLDWAADYFNLGELHFHTRKNAMRLLGVRCGCQVPMILAKHLNAYIVNIFGE